MSNKCLVTKYDGIISPNNDLLKVGEIRIKQSKINSPVAILQALYLQGSNLDVEIIGDGYFTDNTLTANKGKKLNNVENTTIYVSNSECIISIISKYNITAILFREYLNQWKSNLILDNKEIALIDLKYSKITSLTAKCKGDLSDISDKSLTTLNINGNAVTGDISNLKDMTGMTYLSLGNAITGDISNLKDMTGMTYLSLGSAVTGDISNLSNMLKLSQLYLSNSGIAGDISNLANLVKLSSIIVPYNVTGDISTLKNLSCLSSFTTFSKSIYGDLAVMPDMLTILNINNGGNFTWSTRKSTANIISIQGAPKIDNIDKMLQDQANCVVSSDSNKMITATGTRTSASDVAVATLQSKGYTVSITPA